MTSISHDAIVTDQYDSRATAYVASSVHAAGEDLDIMARLVGSRPDARAIDVGCGGGHVAFRLAPLTASVIAHDLTPGMLTAMAEEARRRGLATITTRQGAAESLPDTDASFDIVATRYSAHHWGNLPAGLAQMRRVLKPDGLALFMDVVSPGDPLLDTWLQTLELLRDPSHVRNRSLDEWNTLLCQAGFAVGEIHRFRLRLDFSSWIARMRTPEVQVAAIRALQHRAGSAVTDHFTIETDGSFTIDTALVTAKAA